MIRKQRAGEFLYFLVAAFLMGNAPTAGSAATTEVQPNVDLQTILTRMEAHNRFRAQTLHSYSVERSYKVENKRLNRVAQLSATMIYVAPDEKVFEVHSYEGSSFVRRGVINRMIEAEQKAARSDQQSKNAITSENYEFELLRKETLEIRPQYVLRAKPRRKDQLLLDGLIWVDAEDFAVTRITGKPVKNPSFWTRRVDFTQEYQKIGPYWFASRNTSVTQVLLFGKTTSDLEYSNYQINQPGLAERAAEIRKRGDTLETQIDAQDKK
jgi:hypothetical protein